MGWKLWYWMRCAISMLCKPWFHHSISIMLLGLHFLLCLLLLLVFPKTEAIGVLCYTPISLWHSCALKWPKLRDHVIFPESRGFAHYRGKNSEMLIPNRCSRWCRWHSRHTLDEVVDARPFTADKRSRNYPNAAACNRFAAILWRSSRLLKMSKYKLTISIIKPMHSRFSVTITFAPDCSWFLSKYSHH